MGQEASRSRSTSNADATSTSSTSSSSSSTSTGQAANRSSSPPSVPQSSSITINTSSSVPVAIAVPTTSSSYPCPSSSAQPIPPSPNCDDSPSPSPLPLSLAHAYASSVPSSLMRHVASAASFAELRAHADRSHAAAHLHLVRGDSKKKGLGARRLTAAPMSPSSMGDVARAIQVGLHNIHKYDNHKHAGVTPSDSISSYHLPEHLDVSLFEQDANEQKLILLRSLFQSIDSGSDGYLHRSQLVSWISNEPWLRQECFAAESALLLSSVTHDEDSHVSKNEFVAGFDTFSTDAMVELVVNLLRAGMVSRVPKKTFVYNSHDFYTNGMEHIGGQSSPDDIMSLSSSLIHSPTSMCSSYSFTATPIAADDPVAAHLPDASSSASHASTSSDAARHFWMLTIIFSALDRDLDGELDVKDVERWLRADPWIMDADNGDLAQAVDSCWRELVAKNDQAGWMDNSPQHAASSSSSSSASSVSSSSPPPTVGPARIDRYFFLMQFSMLPKKRIRQLLVHLLSRNVSSVMEDAQLKNVEITKSRRASLGLVEDAVVPSGALLSSMSLSPSTNLGSPSRFFTRRHSIAASTGARRTSSSAGLRVTLVGQSLIQHDVRAFAIGQRSIAEIKPYLAGDCIFTELETSIIRADAVQDKQRSSVFFHAASPDVIDVLTDYKFNMFATSNNHSGDLGLPGITTIIEEFESRKLSMAGIGIDVDQAAMPAYLTTSNGRIASVCFASKIPELSIATSNRAGVNSLSMIDVDNHIVNPSDLARVVSSIQSCRLGSIDTVTSAPIPPASWVLAYHHNHYWEKNANVNEEGAMGNWKRDLAHKLIDNGADAYMAHGDPRLQGIEIYKGKLICYCLGNYYFQTSTKVGFYGGEVWESVIVNMHCDDHDDDDAASSPSSLRLHSIKLTPILLNESGESESTHLLTRGVPLLASRDVGLRILTKLQTMSAVFGTHIEIEDSIEGDHTSRLIGWVTEGGERRQE